MADPEFDAKGDWLPAMSRIAERERVLRDLRAAGYEIVRVEAELAPRTVHIGQAYDRFLTDLTPGRYRVLVVKRDTADEPHLGRGGA